MTDKQTKDRIFWDAVTYARKICHWTNCGIFKGRKCDCGVKQ